LINSCFASFIWAMCSLPVSVRL